MANNFNRSTERSVDAFAEEGVRLSKEFVHHLYGHGFDWCVNRVTQDFIWLGTAKDYQTIGRNDFSTFLEEVASDIPLAGVSNEEYNVVACTERVCTVAGRYLVLTPPDAEMIYAHWNRCTFIWQRSGRRILLSHLHLSAPVDYAEQGEGYAVSAGTEAYKYMRSLIKLGSSRKSVSLYDVDGTVHWVHPSQIVYLEASRKRTIVHCMTKDIVVPAVIRDAIDMVGDKIIRIHRSYAVNRNHVVELKAGMLLLDDGTSIAIPAKRIADVRAALTGR